MRSSLCLAMFVSFSARPLVANACMYSYSTYIDTGSEVAILAGYVAPVLATNVAFSVLHQKMADTPARKTIAVLQVTLAAAEVAASLALLGVVTSNFLSQYGGNTPGPIRTQQYLYLTQRAPPPPSGQSVFSVKATTVVNFLLPAVLCIWGQVLLILGAHRLLHGPDPPPHAVSVDVAPFVSATGAGVGLLGAF